MKSEISNWLKHLSCFLLLLLLFTTSAQASNPLLVEKKHWVMELFMEKGEPRAKVKVSEIYHFTTDKAANHARHSIWYGYFSQLSNVEAYTEVVAANGKTKKYPVLHFTDHAQIDDGIFYSDDRERIFQFPEVVKDARGVVNYELYFKDVNLLSSFFFSYGLPVASANLQLVVPPQFEIAYRLWNADQVDIQFAKTTKGKTTIYSWQAAQLAGMKQFENSPSPRYYHPHLTVKVNAILYKSGWQRFDDVAGLYRTYYPNIRHIYEESHDELKPLVDSILAGKTSDFEKVAAIYQWVQESLKYVAFEENYRGFRPYDPRKVINARFGDCKDMSAVLFSLMRVAGLPAYLAWVGTRDIPYKYSEWATSQVDNHMIAVYHTADTTLFLDGTGSYTPFGFPTSMIQGKEVLIGLSKDAYALVQVPVISAAANQIYDSLHLRWNGRFIEGVAMRDVTGYFKSDYSHLYQHLDEQELRKRLSSHLEFGNNAFSVQNANFENGLRKDIPTRINYNFTLKEYAVLFDDELIINFNLDKSFLKLRDNSEMRQAPIELEKNAAIHREIHFLIPEGYALKSLPENTEISTSGFHFKINYEQEADKIIARSQLINDKLLINPVELADFSTFINSLGNTYRQAIILKKKP